MDAVRDAPAAAQEPPHLGRIALGGVSHCYVFIFVAVFLAIAHRGGKVPDGIPLLHLEQELFAAIVNLRVGEALMFAPSAVIALLPIQGRARVRREVR